MLAGTELYQEPAILKFATPLELLLYLSNDDSQSTGIQNQIRQCLYDDPVVKAWHKQRTNIGEMPHFRKYRKTAYYKRYHEAALAVSNSNASQNQRDLVYGLNQEIAASNNIAPTGQILFHGRGDQLLHTSAIYPSFISTSLDPTVAVYHAIRGKLENGPHGKAMVYLLTLRDFLHAVWGNGGKLKEWELLLQTNLRCSVTQIHQGSRFHVVEAALGL